MKKNKRSLKKNKRTMFYSLYQGKIPILDNYGNETLETKTSYSEPTVFKGSLSTGKGESTESPFGSNVKYDRMITTCDMNIPIDVNSLIWVNNEPRFDDDGELISESADYKVSAPILDGLDSIRIAIKSTYTDENI